jgi:hypothetical protein
MAQEQGDTVRTMLTLAAITYRGIYLALPEPLKRARLRASDGRMHGSGFRSQRQVENRMEACQLQRGIARIG